MVCARKMFKKLQQEKHKQKKNAQKKWKPIMDRKRRSPGTGRSRSGRQGQMSRSGSSSCTSSDNSVQETSSCLTDESRVEKSVNINKSDYSSSSFSTSTPILDRLSSNRSENNASKTNMTEQNKENTRRRCLNVRGRPNMSNLSPLKRKRSGFCQQKSLTQVAMETNEEEDSACSGVSPKKKKRTKDGSVVRQEELRMGDGILSRRRLPKVSGLTSQ